MITKNKCERVVDLYRQILLLRKGIDESITDKTKRIDVMENATNALNSLLYELRGYELVDLRSMMHEENIKEQYSPTDYLAALHDALQVTWFAREMTYDTDFDFVYWCAIFQKDEKFYLFDDVFVDKVGMSLRKGKDLRSWVENKLSSVFAFSTKADVLSWLKKHHAETSHECYKKIIFRLQSAQ